MFYSTDVLSRKSRNGLGVIWLASTSRSMTCKRLSRKDYLSVNLPGACEYLLSPPEPLALRLSSNLMIGITRVYSHQYQYYYQDVQAVFSSLTKSLSTEEAQHKIMMAAPQVRFDTITLAAVSFDFENPFACHNELNSKNLVEFGWLNPENISESKGTASSAKDSIQQQSLHSELIINGDTSQFRSLLQTPSDVSINSDLLHQLQHDHLMGGTQMQQQSKFLRPLNSFGSETGDSFGVSNEDPFEDIGLNIIPMPPLSDVGLVADNGPVVIMNDVKNDESQNEYLPSAGNEEAIVAAQVATEMASKRRKIKHQVNDQVTEMNVKEFLVDGSPSHKETSVIDTKKFRQMYNQYLSGPFSQYISFTSGDWPQLSIVSIEKKRKTITSPHPERENHATCQEELIANDRENSFDLGPNISMDSISGEQNFEDIIPLPAVEHDFSVEIPRAGFVRDSGSMMTPLMRSTTRTSDFRGRYSNRNSLILNSELSSDVGTSGGRRTSGLSSRRGESFGIDIELPKKAGQKDLSEEHRNFLVYVDLMAAKNDAGTVQFEEICPQKDIRRSEAAETFYQILLLTQKRQMSAKQTQPFGPISIQVTMSA